VCCGCCTTSSICEQRWHSTSSPPLQDRAAARCLQPPSCRSRRDCPRQAGACLPSSQPLWKLVFHGAAIAVRFDLRLAVQVCASVVRGARAICGFSEGVEAVELYGAVGVLNKPRSEKGKLRRTQTNEEGQSHATSRAARSRPAPRSLTRRASLAQVEL
jgi:hypothetical protein